MASDCVSCGACVQACPTATLMEKSVIEHGVPDRTVLTTCAYCGVGCSLKAELKGDQVVRMVPVQGRRGQPRARLRQGPLRLGLRQPPGPHHHAHDPRRHRPALARGLVGGGHRLRRRRACKAIQAEHGRFAVGGITSSRCTNEEVWLVMKLVRAAFGNNNVDTCARVCHSPTGYGLKQTFGTSAGTQHFDSVDGCRRRSWSSAPTPPRRTRCSPRR